MCVLYMVLVRFLVCALFQFHCFLWCVLSRVVFVYTVCVVGVICITFRWVVFVYTVCVFGVV
jgi:hypothetical protein